MTDTGKDPGSGGRFARLPDPVDLDATITSAETYDAPDPDAGRDPHLDFTLRYAGL